MSPHFAREVLHEDLQQERLIGKLLGVAGSSQNNSPSMGCPPPLEYYLDTPRHAADDLSSRLRGELRGL